MKQLKKKKSCKDWNRKWKQYLCVHASFLKEKSDKRTRGSSEGAFTLKKAFIENYAHYLPEIASNNGIIVELIEMGMCMSLR